jgi:GPH family glycoside/pentoside/hexuronide:cation symporter
MHGREEPGGAGVPLSTRLLYGSGSVAFGVKDNGFAFFLLLYYNQVLGLSATAAGAALMIALLWDALSDPMVGYVSDHWHSRWGRRHPFMYAAALPFAAGFYLLWSPPPGLSEQALFLYLLVGAVGVRSVLTLYEVPSTSLVAELTRDYDERTALLSFRYFFGWYGGLSMAALAYAVLFVPTPEYPNGVLNPQGYRTYGLVGGVAIGLSVLVAALGTHRYIPRLERPPPRRPFSAARVFRELRQTLSNRSFLALFSGALLFSTGIGVTAALNLYLNTYFWALDAAQIGSIVYFQFASALIAALVAPRLTRRFDKRASAVGLASFALGFGGAPVLLRLAGWFPANESAWLLPILRVHQMVVVAAFITLSITLSSMLADVAEQSELRTKRREEGLFFATQNFALKATSGIGIFLAGIALDLIAFPKDAKPGGVAPEVIFRLGLVLGPGLMLLYAGSVACLLGYRISRTEHEENLRELARRRKDPW